SLGIGACWVCHLPPKKELRKLFNIPGHYDPIALITLGKYEKELKPANKPPVEDILCRNTYCFRESATPLIASWQLMLRRIARKIYYLVPFRRLLDKYAGKYEKKFNNE
ncbi:MAG: hypothetical protein ABIH39_00850, partial [Candidatus Margulisiibacteriota bacterium]